MIPCLARRSLGRAVTTRRWMSAAPAFSQAGALRERGLEVANSPGRGRGLVAARRFEEGEILLTEAPLAWWHDPRAYHESCLQCLASKPSVPSTVAGDTALFCSTQCRDAAAAGVRQVTGLPARAQLDEVCSEHSTRYPAVALEMATQAILLGSEGFQRYWAGVTELHYAQHPEKGLFVTDAHRAEHAAIREALRPVVSGDLDALFSGPYSIEWYTRLLGTLCINAFHVAAGPAPEPVDEGQAQPAAEGEDGAEGKGGLRPTHVALFHAASLLNHSPQPNATVEFPLCSDGSPPLRRESGDWPSGVLGADRAAMSACAAFRTTRSVEAGEELFISYVDPTLPSDERQRRLYKTWGFIEEGEE